MTALQMLREENGEFFPISKIRENWYTYMLPLNSGKLNVRNYIYHLVELDEVVLFGVAESVDKKPLNFAKAYTEPVTDESIHEFMQYLESIPWAEKNTIQKLPGLRLRGFDLDSIMILPPEEYQSKLFSTKELVERTIQVFPIHNFEFSGTETQDEINDMTFYNLYTLDWKRTPYPKVKVFYRFSNIERVKGKEAVRTTLPSLMHTLERMKSGFMEIMNYKENKIRIDFAGEDLFRVEQQTLDREALQAYVHEFVYQAA